MVGVTASVQQPGEGRGELHGNSEGGGVPGYPTAPLGSAKGQAGGEGCPLDEGGEVVDAEGAEDVHAPGVGAEGLVSGWVPEFPGQRPPFQPGNSLGFTAGHTKSLQHGVYSPRTIEPRARLVVDQLLEQPGVQYLQAPEYRASVWRYAQRQARADLMHDQLLAHAESCDGDAECATCLSYERRWREFDTAAGKASERLGLDPLSRARLGKDVAQGRAADAAAIMAQLHRMEREGRIPPSGGASS